MQTDSELVELSKVDYHNKLGFTRVNVRITDIIGNISRCTHF